MFELILEMGQNPFRAQFKLHFRVKYFIDDPPIYRHSTFLNTLFTTIKGVKNLSEIFGKGSEHIYEK